MTKVTIEIEDRPVREALQRLHQAAGDPSPALLAIGEHLVFLTKQRFQTSTAPDGSRWPDNSDVTLLKFMESYTGSFRKGRTPTGGRGISEKGAARLGSKKPLIGETKALSSTITYQLAGKNAVEVGSPMEYAATQQCGAEQGAFGRTRRNSPIPWGDIPPRPFVGLGTEDRDAVLGIIRLHLQSITAGER